MRRSLSSLTALLALCVAPIGALLGLTWLFPPWMEPSAASQEPAAAPAATGAAVPA